tara:strand:- start:544 stop:756 length:213 start_codon:yes stop_codon:yes gene_type:complete
MKLKTLEMIDLELEQFDDDHSNKKNLKAFMGFSKHIPTLGEKQIPIIPKYKNKLKTDKYIKPNKDNISLF